jgi:hypothetical protein
MKCIEMMNDPLSKKELLREKEWCNKIMKMQGMIMDVYDHLKYSNTTSNTP